MTFHILLMRTPDSAWTLLPNQASNNSGSQNLVITAFVQTPIRLVFPSFFKSPNSGSKCANVVRLRPSECGGITCIRWTFFFQSVCSDHWSMLELWSIWARLSKVRSGPQMSRSRSRYGWTWTRLIGPVQLVSGPDPDRTLLWIFLKNPFKTSQRTYFLDNYLQIYCQNDKNFRK